MAADSIKKISDKKARVIDLIVVTNRQRIDEALTGLLREKDLEWVEVSVDKFYRSVKEWGFIGTALIDTADIDPPQVNNLIQTIKYLEQKKVASILLNDFIQFPIQQFDKVSDAAGETAPEIWNRISYNLRSRKKDIKKDMVEQTRDNASPERQKNNAPVPLQNLRLTDDNLLEEQTGASERNAPPSPQYSEMAEQLKMAGKVQRTFLPEKLPQSEKLRWAVLFEPADWVSGDIYDVTRLDEQHIGFYIADAVGHSMPAALLTMFIKQAITMRQTHGSDYEIFSPRHVVSRLNDRMAEQNITGSLFATCCYCLLNFKTLQLSICRGGHPYPILIRKDRPLQPIETRGALVGVFEQSQFEQTTIQLTAGDKLLIYSDGADSLIGSCDDNGTFRYSEKFTAITKLPAEKMIQEFGNIARQTDIPPAEHDDITAVVLEIL